MEAHRKFIYRERRGDLVPRAVEATYRAFVDDVLVRRDVEGEEFAP